MYSVNSQIFCFLVNIYYINLKLTLYSSKPYMFCRN